MPTTTLPPEMIASIGSESIDFSAKASRAKPLKKSLTYLAFSLFFLAFTSLFVVTFFGPLFMGQEVHFTSNGEPVTASMDNLKPIATPAVIIGIFVLVGLGLTISAFISLFETGGYFAGTPNRLVWFKKGALRSIDWEQFSGDISVNGNAQSGNLSLELRTGHMVSQKNGPSRYVPEVIYVAGVPEVYEIERLCRERIKQNDPTPPTPR